MIYICRVFNHITESHPGISSLLFMNDLGFIASRCLVKELAYTFGQVAKVILKWEKFNAVTYNIVRTKAVFFSKLHH